MIHASGRAQTNWIFLGEMARNRIQMEAVLKKPEVLMSNRQPGSHLDRVADIGLK